MAEITITCAEGRPIQALNQLIDARNKWLNETAEQACTAALIDVLVSLRAQTVVASPRKFEVDLNLHLTEFQPGFTGGKANPKLCLRVGKARYALQPKERLGSAAVDDFKNCRVWRWMDVRDREWLIVAHSRAEAIKWAFDKIKKRAAKYKGLAKMALTQLMMKSGSVTAPSTENANAVGKSQEVTNVVKTSNGDQFSVQADDMLNYARYAMWDGDNSINVAVMKASNKIASVINQKCKNLLMFGKIETPFPEVRSRR
jgi:hypothetical protein